MKKTIESSWDYYRKLNLILISIVTLSITVGFITFEKPSLTFILISSLFICFFTFLLFLRKSIFIENDKISGFHTFLGARIKKINSFSYSNNTTVSTKKYKTSSYYQKGKKYEPELHVDENIFEIFIDNKHFITFYSTKGFEKFMLLISS